MSTSSISSQSSACRFTIFVEKVKWRRILCWGGSPRQEFKVARRQKTRVIDPTWWAEGLWVLIHTVANVFKYVCQDIHIVDELPLHIMNVFPFMQVATDISVVAKIIIGVHAIVFTTELWSKPRVNLPDAQFHLTVGEPTSLLETTRHPFIDTPTKSCFMLHARSELVTGATPLWSCRHFIGKVWLNVLKSKMD